jgi:N-methylhydantoinase A
MAGEAAGARNLITVDIGGTSCDIALIENGTPALRSEGVIDRYPVRVSMVDVNSIGSGGGSIAWLDTGGGLRVGPRSAGSEPGPACYGLGGNEPTVTDASLVLGYLHPEHFAGGSLRLRPELAGEAIERAIARPLKLSVEQAALGIHRIMNTQVAEGIRLVSIRQGYDPRKFTLLPLGGGGALHACALAEELGITSILVPRHPGVLSAAGLLAAPIEHEVSTGLPRNIDAIDPAEIEVTRKRLDAQCGALMAQENVSENHVSRRYFADVCYVGQGYHLEVPFDPNVGDPLAALTAAFYAAHERTFGFARKAPLRLVALRTVHSVAAVNEPEEKWAPCDGARQHDPEKWEPVFGKRSCSNKEVERDDDSRKNRPALGPRRARILLSEHQGAVDVAVYDRAGLESGATFNGPAIVEQADTTTLLLPGWRARLDALGNLVLDRL